MLDDCKYDGNRIACHKKLKKQNGRSIILFGIQTQTVAPNFISSQLVCPISDLSIPIQLPFYYFTLCWKIKHTLRHTYISGYLLDSNYPCPSNFYSFNSIYLVSVSCVALHWKIKQIQTSALSIPMIVFFTSIVFLTNVLLPNKHQFPSGHKSFWTTRAPTQRLTYLKPRYPNTLKPIIRTQAPIMHWLGVYWS